MGCVKEIDVVAALKKIGRERPETLIERLNSLGLSDTECEIVKLRYIDGLLFKQILDKVNIKERYMYRVHKKAITKAVDNINWLIS